MKKLDDTRRSTLTHHVALRIGKRLRRPLGKLLGRRAVVAGLVSPLVAGASMEILPNFFSFVPWESPLYWPAFAVSCAVATAVAGLGVGASMFARRRPKLPGTARMRELAGEPLEEWFERVEREADLAERGRRRNTPKDRYWFANAPA
jgi:hypothetical protein